jgi:predicted dehydrogenase
VTSIGIVGAGQFSRLFAKLWKAHPLVSRVLVTDVVRERAEWYRDNLHLDGIAPDFDALLATDVDAVAIFTQRWTHASLVVQALRAGKHVYSAVPMAITRDEIAEIIRAVEDTGLTYMMGETSYYNATVVYARKQAEAGAFGRLFYAEGDYVHDMDLGFYDAYRYSGGDDWKRTASYPPMLYPTHSIGGVLGAWPTHAVSVSCIGIRDDRGDGVFDRAVSMFDNDFSNASALFELADGGAMRTNEMRRVGYRPDPRESRFRFFGTEASFEQLNDLSLWQTKEGAEDVSALLKTNDWMDAEYEHASGILADVPEELRSSFISGHAPVHDTSALPASFAGMMNGHEGSHHLLAHEFVAAIDERRLPAIHAWAAARYTLPGIVAHESARRDGERLRIDDFGEPPARLS